MKDKEKLPKRQDKNPVDEALEAEELTDLEEEPQFEQAKVEVINLMTITNKLTKIDKDVFDMGASLDVALESIKALGANVIENNEATVAAMNDLSAQMATLNTAFIKYQATNLLVPIPTPTAKASNNQQPQSNSGFKKINLPAANTFPISETAKKELVFAEREGIGTTVKFKIKVSSEDWNATNSFLRTLGMKWVSDRIAKIYEWQPK